MESHQCPRCGYSTVLLQNIKKHLFQRKTLCPCILSDNNLIDFRKQYDNHVADEERPFKCTDCQQCFKYQSGLSRHKKVYHSRPGFDDRDKRIRELEAQLQHITTLPTANNVTINNITNHVQQNTVNTVNINPFGSEDQSHLTEAFLSRCVRKTNVGLIELLDRLHFGEAMGGSNANVRCLNKKLPLIETQDNHGKWRYERRDKVLNAMLDRGHSLMFQHFDDHQDTIKENMSESMYEYIVEFFQKLEDKDKSTIEELLLDVYILILNNSRS